MRSAIWKLSALATVVGVSLVTVVFLQGGLGKFTGAKTAAAPAPAPNVPKGKSSASSTTDPFANPELGNPESEGGTSDANPPGQTLVENAPGAETLGSELDDASFASPTTKTRARALNFKEEAAVVEPGGTELVDDEAISSVRPRRAGSLRAAAVSGAGEESEPAVLEGVSPSDHELTTLTDDEDPFPKHKQAKTGATSPRGARPATASRSRPGNSDLFDESDQSAGTVPAGNPFDQQGEAMTAAPTASPAVGKSFAKSRASAKSSLIDDGDPVGQPPVGGGTWPAQSQVPNEVVNDEPLPTDIRRAAAPRGNPANLIDDGGFNESTTEAAEAPVETAPPVRSSKPNRTQPRFDDDDEIDGARSADVQNDRIQPIPKLRRDSETVDDGNDQLTPPIATTAGQRPNSLAEDDGELPTKPRAKPAGVPAKTESTSAATDTEFSDPQITDSAIPVPNTKRPSKHVFEMEDDAPLTNQSAAAAASKSPNTDIIANPRVAATSAVPGTVAIPGGRGRVTIDKRAPATAYIGQPLIYQIVIRNVGTGPAQQVVVQDVVPEGVTIDGSIPQAELVGKKLSWKLGILVPGEERNIRVKIIPNTAGALGSAATVNFVADPMFASAEVDPVLPATLQPDAQSSYGPTAPSPHPYGPTAPNPNNSPVSLVLQGPVQVALGQPFDIRFRLTNRTTQPLNDLIIRKMLPDGLVHQSRIQDLEYRVGPLAAGETRDVTMTLTAAQPGRAISRAIVMTPDAKVLQTTEFAVEIGAVGSMGPVGQTGAGGKSPGAGSEFPVTVERIGSARPALNRTVSYTNRITNRGSRPTGGLRVTETLPLGMDFVSAGYGGQYDPATRRVTWELLRLDPNATAELQISVVVKDRNPQISSILVTDKAGNQADTAAQVVASNSP